jgi:translation initiation factor IF-3
MRINERIRVPQIRVVGDEGEQLGVMGVRAAIEIARSRGMDLVEVAPNADPPVCRIIDYGKYQYEQKKKAHEAKKKQVVITVKEIKFRPGTDDHDYQYRVKHAREWLQDGDKVKATIWFRGREMAHRNLGARILERVEQDLADIGDVEQRPKMEGNQMFLIIAPKRQKGGEKRTQDGAPKTENAGPSAKPSLDETASRQPGPSEQQES